MIPRPHFVLFVAALLTVAYCHLAKCQSPGSTQLVHQGKLKEIRPGLATVEDRPNPDGKTALMDFAIDSKTAIHERRIGQLVVVVYVSQGTLNKALSIDAAISQDRPSGKTPVPDYGLVASLSKPTVEDDTTKGYRVSYPAAAAEDPAAASVDFISLKDDLAFKLALGAQQVAELRAMIHQKGEILKQARRLDAANKRLLAEKQKLTEENARLEKVRASIGISESIVSAAK